MDETGAIIFHPGDRPDLADRIELCFQLMRQNQLGRVHLLRSIEQWPVFQKEPKPDLAVVMGPGEQLRR